MPENLLFQYCQKLVIFDKEIRKVLLAKRKGEADYDGTYSFIGGKMETTDESIISGMRREKNEEIGENAKVLVWPNETNNLLFRKKDGNSMILPHIAGIFLGGEIELNDEYSDFAWVDLDNLGDFEPKIDSVQPMSEWAAMKLRAIALDNMVEL